ncbi:Gfo/Idh/MocA family protein [Rubinisphaera margarita]|uniref:Gfo/Idh/MocA family protein n=1 Tax=Rubinisphaera margarita TaxID=2909586 RepID=UPI001EE9A7CF|nr:Gfo/Idh/MocA family oxidoreductase [Rubinisphaera margarita]MCG6156541.1 Gfo/Idh/MocA family oxidoreductase [Rubinisphaera margarita]
MTRKLRAAVAGTGFIGPVHIEALRRAGVEVTGILGSSPEKSNRAGEQLGLPRGYASLEEILQDDSVDSVHLATPNRLHYEQTVAVLKAGKHVLCEKPLAMNSQQSAELVELAAKSDCVAGVAYNIRFYPLCHEAAARVADGSVGDVLHVTGSYVQDWLLYETDFNWRVVAEDGGELRAVADIGTHWLDLLQFITGRKVTEVFADLRTVHPIRKQPVGGSQTFSGGKAPAETKPVEITTEDCGSILLRFDNGANGCLWVSQTTAGRKNCLQFELAGSKASLAWNSETPNEITIGHRNEPNERLIRDPALLHTSAGGVSNYPGGHNEGFPDTFKQLCRAFYGYIATGDYTAPAPFPTFADGHREILLCEAILTSHREQRWISTGVDH